MYNLVFLDISQNILNLIEANAFFNLNQLTDLYLNDNPDLKIKANALDGIKSIRNVYINIRLFLNLTFKSIFKKSIIPRTYKTMMSRVYYESIDVIYDGHLDVTMDECLIILYFVRFNIQFNLRDSSHIKYFEDNCLFHLPNY